MASSEWWKSGRWNEVNIHWTSQFQLDGLVNFQGYRVKVDRECSRLARLQVQQPFWHTGGGMLKVCHLLWDLSTWALTALQMPMIHYWLLTICNQHQLLSVLCAHVCINHHCYWVDPLLIGIGHTKYLMFDFRFPTHTRITVASAQRLYFEVDHPLEWNRIWPSKYITFIFDVYVGFVFLPNLRNSKPSQHSHYG